MLNSLFARALTATLGVCLLASAGRAADEELVESPQYKSWASHKVGSAVTHESSTATSGQTFKTVLTQKLVELTPEKAVVEMTMKIDVAGAPAPPTQKQEFPAKVKKSEATVGKLPEGMKGEVKDKGNEKVAIGGKNYTCKVYEFTGDQSGIKTTGKSWTSEEVPGMLVKMESSANVGGQDMKTTMALTKVEKK